MPKSLMKEVAEYCWSNNFLNVFHKFFADHAAAFEDAPAMHAGEHNLEYYRLFQVYLGVYEDSLTTYLNTLDCPIEEFYRELRETQNTTTDPYMLTFIDCLLASADYDSFYKVMAKEGAKFKAKKILLGGSSVVSAHADAKADGKTTDARGDRDTKSSDSPCKAEGKSDSK